MKCVPQPPSASEGPSGSLPYSSSGATSNRSRSLTMGAIRSGGRAAERSSRFVRISSSISWTSLDDGSVPPLRRRTGTWMSFRSTPGRANVPQWTKATTRSSDSSSALDLVRTRTCGPMAAIAKRPIPFSPRIGRADCAGSVGGGPMPNSLSSLLSVPRVSHRSMKS